MYAQDTWQIAPRFTLNYGLLWEAQIFPKMVIARLTALYGQYLPDPRFPFTKYLPNQTKEFQPRGSFNHDIFGNGKSSLRSRIHVLNSHGSDTQRR